MVIPGLCLMCSCSDTMCTTNTSLKCKVESSDYSCHHQRVCLEVRVPRAKAKASYQTARNSRMFDCCFLGRYSECRLELNYCARFIMWRTVGCILDPSVGRTQCPCTNKAISCIQPVRSPSIRWYHWVDESKTTCEGFSWPCLSRFKCPD